MYVVDISLERKQILNALKSRINRLLMFLSLFFPFIQFIIEIQIYNSLKRIFNKLNLNFNYNFLEIADIPILSASLILLVFQMLACIFFLIFPLLFALNKNNNSYLFTFCPIIIWCFFCCFFCIFIPLILSPVFFARFINKSFLKKAEICRILFNITQNHYFLHASNSFLNLNNWDYFRGRWIRNKKIKQPYIDLINAFSSLPDYIQIYQK